MYDGERNSGVVRRGNISMMTDNVRLLLFGLQATGSPKSDKHSIRVHTSDISTWRNCNPAHSGTSKHLTRTAVEYRSYAFSLLFGRDPVSLEERGPRSERVWRHRQRLAAMSPGSGKKARQELPCLGRSVGSKHALRLCYVAGGFQHFDRSGGE